jgi:hypothetical protein
LSGTVWSTCLQWTLLAFSTHHACARGVLKHRNICPNTAQSRLYIHGKCSIRYIIFSSRRKYFGMFWLISLPFIQLIFKYIT